MNQRCKTEVDSRIYQLYMTIEKGHCPKRV